MAINRMLRVVAKPNRHRGLQAQLSWEHRAESPASCFSLGTYPRVSEHWEDESEEVPASHSALFMSLNLLTCNRAE